MRTTTPAAAAIRRPPRVRASKPETRSSCTPGHYNYHREFYGPDRSVNVTSPYRARTTSRRAEPPTSRIAIKAAGDGEVILDGNGNFNLFNVMAAHYNYFEGLTFRNTDIAIWAGTQFIAGPRG